MFWTWKPDTFRAVDPWDEAALNAAFNAIYRQLEAAEADGLRVSGARAAVDRAGLAPVNEAPAMLADAAQHIASMRAAAK